MLRGPLLVLGSALLSHAWCAHAAVVVLQQNFDDIDSLAAAGWVSINNSSPPGVTGWFQGNSAVFPAQSGAPDSYIAANLNNASFGGNISNWLLTPAIWVHDGDSLRFATRTESAAAFADRLEVRLSRSGNSTDVGGTDTSVGDFQTLLLAVNPGLVASGYPRDWTFYEVTLSGIATPAGGRLAFRYAVADTSVNGDYIGLDSATITQIVPEPATFALMGLSLAAMAVRRKRSRAIAAAIAALLLFSARPAAARDAPKLHGKTSPAKPAVKSVKATSPGNAGSRVAIDPRTGQIREPEQDEIQALERSINSLMSRRALTMTQGPNGTKAVKLDDRYLSFSVATKNPDGSLSLECVPGNRARHTAGAKGAC